MDYDTVSDAILSSHDHAGLVSVLLAMHQADLDAAFPRLRFALELIAEHGDGPLDRYVAKHALGTKA
jgi:hypothetical protein